MIIYAVLAQVGGGVSHEFLAAYSTLERAQHFANAQNEDLRAALVVWDVEIDRHPSSGYWVKPEWRHPDPFVEAVLEDLVGIAARIVSESGAPDATKTFDARRWVEQWVSTPHPALGDKPPTHLLHTPEGAEQVRALLRQQQSGAYA